jgi:hypothetical protein
MTVQDDERERELVRLFNLSWDPAHQRAGIDAELLLERPGGPVRIEVEVKSTTGSTVSTARDVGMDHIAKWQRKLFVIGFYTRDARRPELMRCLCLTPGDMAPWIEALQAKIAVDFRIAGLAAGRLTLDDLHAICGDRAIYPLSDARALFKRQWTLDQYQSACDVEHGGQRGYSPAAMLRILALRARYLAERGATLNNPHITDTHLSSFAGTDREIRSDWARRIREIADAWLSADAPPA